MLSLRQISLDCGYRLLKIRVSATTSVFDSAPGHHEINDLNHYAIDFR
jgi:hypothetical protein